MLIEAAKRARAALLIDPSDPLAPEDFVGAPDDTRELALATIALEEACAALADIAGLLDDPTGGEHVNDMRQASRRAREALGLSKAAAD